jgi:pimeloyl-ACP methyl ester carboxylesterase
MSLPGRLHTISGVRIFVHQSGTPARGKTPIVLVHGWLLSHYMWRHIVGPLTQAGHSVIALDLPGFGESDRPSTASYRYDTTAFSDTVLDLLDSLSIERAILCGMSLGGAVALVTAARHPERVERLALIDTVVYPTPLPPEGYAVKLPVVGQFLFRLALARKNIRAHMKRDIYFDPSFVTDEWVDYVWERAQRPGGVEAAHRALEILENPDTVMHSIAAVRAPTLIAWGEQDQLFPVAHGRRLHGQLTGSELRVIPACGHSPAEEKPEELLAALLPFLDPRPRSAA